MLEAAITLGSIPAPGIWKELNEISLASLTSKPAFWAMESKLSLPLLADASSFFNKSAFFFCIRIRLILPATLLSGAIPSSSISVSTAMVNLFPFSKMVEPSFVFKTSSTSSAI